ncbi:MAG: ABC transporter substrate-binding protein [Candidatus Melainabacteria bacterium]|nr:ABC transporter substrate-binding protein [Candidatus Melainabacteria bacterium]
MIMRSLPPFVLLCCLLVVGCTRLQPAAVSDPTGVGSRKPLTIAQFGHIFLYLPLYVALDNGYFNDEGLDVKLISTGGDEKTFAAVSSGNAQFGVADPTFTAIAREHGQGGKVVASVVNGVPFWGVAFRDDIKPIHDVTKLAGLRIATFTAPSTNYTVIKEILQNKGRPIKAKIVQGAPTGSIVAMVKANQADIAMELEPAASIAVSQGAHVVLSLQKEFGDFAITGLTVADYYHDQNGDTIRSVVKALARAMKYIHGNFNGTIEIAKKEFPEVDDSILRAALRRMLDEGTIPSTPVMTKEAWDKAILLRRRTGDIKGDGSFETNVNMKFAHDVTQ